MYHCEMCFYAVNCEDDFYAEITKIEPLKHFSHRFVKSSAPEAKLLAEADVIFVTADADGKKTYLDAVLFGKKEDAEVILLADKGLLDGLTEEEWLKLSEVWTLPLGRQETAFRFGAWQKKSGMAKELWKTSTYLDTLINSVPDLVWYKDKEGAHLKVNESFCKAVNKTMEQIEGRGHNYIWDITPDEYAKGEYICMESEYEVMEKKETCIFDENVKIGDKMRQLETYKSPLFDLDGSVMGTVGIAKDVTQERIYEQMLVDNANTDLLTGLYNRRYIYHLIEQEKEQPITVFYLDLDNFKHVNDCYGHLEGDRALVLTSKTLQKALPEDIIARLGGDEFLVVSIGSCTKQEAEDKKNYIQEQLDKAFQKQEHFQHLSVSIGMAQAPKGRIVIDKLLSRADSYMYREKNRKKFPLGNDDKAEQ